MNLQSIAEALDLSKAEQTVVVALLALLAALAGWQWRADRTLDRGLRVVVRAPQAAVAKIDLNSAAWHDLVVLPGIGPKRAQNIIALRNSLPHARFQSVADLALAKSVPAKVVEQIRPYVFLGGGGKQR